jgi:hypothetical protein
LAAANTSGALDRVEPVHFVKNVPVFIARSFVGTNGGDQLDLLSRTRQVGEYNIMFDENSDWSDYKSASRDIAIYNQTEDKFNKITLAEAIRNCGRFADNGVVAPQQDPRGDVGAHDSDLNDDFMVYNNGQGKKSVQYICDMSYEFLGDDLLRNAGRTVAKALMARGLSKEDANIIMSEIQTPSNVDIDTGIAIYPAPVRAGERAGVYETFAKLANMIGGLLGDTVFLTFAKSIRASDPDDILYPGRNDQISDGQVLWRLLVVPERVPVYYSIVQEVPIRELPRNVGSQVNTGTERVDNAFFSTLRAAVPESRRAHIQSIIDQARVPVLERAEQIRDALFEMVDSKVAGIPWANQAAAHDWYQKRVDQYQTKIGAPVSSDPAPVSNADGKTKIGYAYPGQQLPAGWSYVNSAAAHRHITPVKSDIAHCCQAIPFIADDIDAAASQRSTASSTQSRGYGESDEAGLGLLSRVGMLNVDQDKVYDRRSKARPAGEGYGQLNKRFFNLGELLAIISKYNMSSLDKICSMLYIGAPMNLNTMLGFAAADIVVPMGFVLFRPHMQVRTRIAIKVETDGGAGNMFFGHSDMQIQNEAGRKIGLAHYTTYQRLSFFCDTLKSPFGGS